MTPTHAVGADGDPADIAPARAEDAGPLGDLVAAAFDADPLFTWVLPDRAQRRRRLARWATASVRLTLSHGVVDTAGGRGMASWQPPGRTPSALDRLRDGAVGAQLALGPGGLARIAAADRQAHAARRAHDPGGSWYLALLAVHPGHRGQGLAGALLRHGLARADRTASPVWLETNAARNVSIYERFGFEVVAHEPEGQLPEFWGLLRPGQGSPEPPRAA
ncbi:MAG: GNAT family N-acetyltransferase [Actinomycetaceae bacterium]